MATTWCWEKLSGLCGCRPRENPHENRPGILGPVNVETIRIYSPGGGGTVTNIPQFDEEEMEGNPNSSEGARGSSADPRPGSSREGMEDEDPDAIHAAGEGPDAEVVVERSVEEVEVTEETPKLSKLGRLRALFSRGMIHRLRRLSDEAMHRLNIPEQVQLSRRRVRIAQIRNWREREWSGCSCFTEGRRCCRRRRNVDRAVHFGPEPNPDQPIEEENQPEEPNEQSEAPQQLSEEIQNQDK